MNPPRRTLTKAALTTLLSLTALAAASPAQAEYPERPITLIVPYSPGGAADSLARALGKKMGEQLGTTVVVDNRAGASGTIGVSLATQAAADGYTVLYDATPYSINPHLFAKLPYSPEALQPVALEVVDDRDGLVVRRRGAASGRKRHGAEPDRGDGELADAAMV